VHKLAEVVMVLPADDQNVHPSRLVADDQVSESFKKQIINTARSWPVYFSRLFSVSVSSRLAVHSTPDAAYCYRYSVVCLPVGEPCKTALQPIEILHGTCTRGVTTDIEMINI